MAVRGEEAGLKMERDEKVARRVRKAHSNGVGDEFGAVGSSSGWEEVNGAVIHDAVRWASGEAVPLGPPAAGWVSEGAIRRVLEEEVHMVDAGGGGVKAVGVGSGERGVDADKVPARASSAVGYVRNEKQFVVAGADSGGKSGG